MSFLESAQGDGRLAQRSIRHHSSLHVSDNNDWRDFCFAGGSLLQTPGTIDRAKVSAEAQEPLDGKIQPGSFDLDLGDVDPENWAFLHSCLNVFGAVTITDLTGGAWEWHFFTDGTTDADSYLEFRDDDDHNPASHILSTVLGSMTLTAENDGNFRSVFGGEFGSKSRWGARAQVTGTGSDLPTIVGTLPASFDSGDSDALHILVDSKAGNVLTLKAARGATPAGSTTFDYDLDEAPALTRITLDDGSIMGSFGQPIKIGWPASATVAALDEFTIQLRRARWTASAGTERPISSVETQVYRDNVELPTEGGWEFRYEYPTITNDGDTSGRELTTPERSGTPTGIFVPTRKMRDITFQKSLYDGSTVSIVADARHNVEISSSGFYPRATLILPAVKPINQQEYDVGFGDQDNDESIEMQAFVPDSAFTYESDNHSNAVHLKVVNSKASLTV